MRIQIRPPRLICRVMARRAASIWRAVRRPRPIAFRPYSPKLTLAPTVATPLLRPFWSLRYFLLAGCSILCSCAPAHALGRFRCRRRSRLRLGVARQHLALEYPDLDADYPVGRLRFGKPVVDVGAQRMQWHAALAIPLGARDFDAVQSASAHDLDALRAEAHRVLHGALHRPAEHDPFLELLRDRIGDELRVDLGLADFLDVETDLGAHHLAQVRAQRLDVLALLADDNTGARAVDRDPRVLRWTLDRDLGHRCVRELLAQIGADLDVLVEGRREVLAVRVPLRGPVAIHREAESGRMDLLSHELPSLAVADGQMDVAGLLQDHVAATFGAGREAAQVRRLVDVHRLDFELVNIRTVVVLRVGDRRLEHALDDLRALFRAEAEHVERLAHRQATDLIGDEPALL